MGRLFGVAAGLVAVAALGQLTMSAPIRRLMITLFGRALPGARTGLNEPVGSPRPEASARLEWTEVENLTASRLAARPRSAGASPEETETASSFRAVETR